MTRGRQTEPEFVVLVNDRSGSFCEGKRRPAVDEMTEVLRVRTATPLPKWEQEAARLERRRIGMENAQSVDALSEHVAHRAAPWNKGKLTGAKAPLQPKHVWAIRTRLQMAGRTRDLALFNIARGCDVVSLTVEDIAPRGYTLDRATIRRRKTGRPVSSKSRSRPGRPLTIILPNSERGRVTSCLLDRGGI